MAVEEKARRRKRKHADKVDEGEIAVPKKVAKRTKTPKESPQESETAPAVDPAEDEASHEEPPPLSNGIANQKGVVNGISEEKQPNFDKNFDIVRFRNKLKSTMFISELQHFLHLAKTDPQIVEKYIGKHGKPLELVEALERIDRENVVHVAYLCQALQLVIMEIVSNQQAHMVAALNACRYFLKSYSPLIDLLLKSPQWKHRCTALKLLTGIVCVEPQLGRQLLTAFDILSNVQKINEFLSHQANIEKDEDTVRKCFIHFVLAYLVDGNTLLIRNILDRGVLIHALSEGLLYDDHVTVCVVLSTLQKYVLECEEISKTRKLRVFDVGCCKHFVRLYDWVGPAHVQGKQKLVEGQNRKHIQPENSEKREAVVEAVHSFLMMLLTSRKHGVAFDSMKHFGQKYNALQGRIAGMLRFPHQHPRKAELIISILKACPELGRQIVRHFMNIVNPMYASQLVWDKAANFLAELIATASPKMLLKVEHKITLTDFAYWIKQVCLPIESLVYVRNSGKLKATEFSIRMAANRLILAMITQYNNYMTTLAKREKQMTVNAWRRFKFDILNHILVNFPPVKSILYSLFVTIQLRSKMDVDVLEHLEVTLDLIIAICKYHRSFVDKTGDLMSYIELLRPLYAGEAQYTDRRLITIELKAVKTILLLNPKDLEPGTALFKNVLASFIKTYTAGDDDMRKEAGNLLHSLFKNSGLFECSELEINLWLVALQFSSMKTVTTMIQVFQEVFEVTEAEVDEPRAVENEANLSNVRALFDNIEQGLSVESYVEMVSISKLLQLIVMGVEKVQPLVAYLDIVYLFLFHYYPRPSYIESLHKLKKEHQHYTQNWLSKQKPLEAMPKIAGFMSELQAAILHGEQTFEDIFAGSKFELTLPDGKTLKLGKKLKDQSVSIIYIQQILFMVIQLNQLQILERAHAERAAEFFNSFVSIVQALEEESTQNEHSFGDSDTQQDSFLDKLLKYVFSARLTQVHTADLFCNADDWQLNFQLFLTHVVTYCNQMERFAVHTGNFRLKLVKAVAISCKQVAQTKALSEKLTQCIPLLQAFKLDVDNCLELLELLATNLEYSDFYNETNKQWSIYYDLLIFVLQRLAELKAAVKCNAFMKKLCQFYRSFNKRFGADISLELLDEALYNFLLVSHQNIGLLNAKFFASMFVERKLNKYSIRLACLLLERNCQLQASFCDLLAQHLEKRELVYPLLDVAFEHRWKIEDALLQRIYQTYRNGFMKTIEKPQKAGSIYKEHVACSIALIEQCMPPTECVDFCNKHLKIDGVETYQLRLLHAIYKKGFAAATGERRTKIFVNLIQLLVQLVGMDLKKQILDQDKLEVCVYVLYDWWQQKPAECVPDAQPYAVITSSSQWLNFIKSALKLAMHTSDSEAVEAQPPDAPKALLLSLLAYLCTQLYADVSAETEAETAELAQICELVRTHSQFDDILLQQHASPVKTQLLHLLYTLGRKNPNSLDASQIPIILGAYQAKLSDADRYCLALLQLYELHDRGIQKYRPFIWGESAIAFYALRATETEQPTQHLRQPETSIEQVMALIDRQVCEHTIENFPVWRKLNSSAQLPLVEYKDPALKALHVGGTNELEQRVERGVTSFGKDELNLCPKRAGTYAECYDPAFFVPLMCMCFAPESYIHTARPVQNGILALTFTALSSQDKEMRVAAACVHLRYRSHFEGRKFFGVKMWTQFYENIQAGLSELREKWLSHKRHHGLPRVALIPSLFIAKTFNITNTPTHLLYKPLTTYLCVKSSFNFECVPEFNILFFSAEVEHHTYRQFILEVMRQGIKCYGDFFLLVSTHTFKVLMGFYGSAASDLTTNLLILSIFSTCVKIPAASKIMVEHVGILSWVSAITSSVEFHEFDIIDGLISIISNLWYAMQANAAEFQSLAPYAWDLHRLVLHLVPKLSPRISLPHFCQLVNVLRKTCTGKEYHALPSEQLQTLISCTRVHFGEHVGTIENIRTLGSACAASDAAYINHLRQQDDLSEHAIAALVNLRAYVIGWWECNNNKGVGIDGAAGNAGDPDTSF